MKERISWGVGSASGIAGKEKPPRWYPGGEKDPIGWASAFERVTALSILDLCGRYGQAHLLAQDPRNKPSDRVSLPAGGFHQIRSGGATGALQQVKELGGFAALADSGGFHLRLARLRAFVGLLGPGGLGDRRSLGRRDVSRVSCALRPFGGKGLHRLDIALVVGGVGTFFCNLVHFAFSFGGDYRDDHINRSTSTELQVESCTTPHNPQIGEGLSRQTVAGGGPW